MGEYTIGRHNSLGMANSEELAYTFGKITAVDGDKANETDGKNVFGTGYWAVALNGKLVSEDLGTVAIEEGDRVVVYWNDPTFDTKLVQVDDSLIAKGVLSYYYFDAEGNQLTLASGATTCEGDVTVKKKNE